MGEKNIHKDLLEILTEFDKICRLNSIQYTLHGGTLLGAVRERGFIPWDDDLDIAMTRNEFNRLGQALSGNADHYISGEIKKQFRRRGSDSLWIDIFVCDFIGNGIEKSLKCAALTALDIMSRNRKSVTLSNVKKYGMTKQVAFKLIYYMGKLVPQPVKTKLYTDISEQCWLGDGTQMHRSNDQYRSRKMVFPAEWMSEYRMMEFEGKLFPVTGFYHELLVQAYGEDYMKPMKDERNKVVHDIVRSPGTWVSE
jgi:phosphorylcholine metabolism protein LicD